MSTSIPGRERRGSPAPVTPREQGPTSAGERRSALPAPALPRSVVVILLDSLNRHLLGPYGGQEFATPNLDRLASRSLRFTRHYAGSLPCIPARHDILCGALDFLWKPWGSVEAWEEPITVQLADAGVTTMLVSDHPHLFETGGENYHTDFTAWEYLRGHESDPWRTRPDPSWAGTPVLFAAPAVPSKPYDTSRTWFRDESDFPGPKTMRAAATWLEHDAPHADRFLLFVDEFDPHEPFDTPEPWATRYDDSWEGPRLVWPPYGTRVVESGVLTPREAHHVRANYGGKLSMIDHWLGTLLDVMDATNRWEDTAFILCTDHGHYLGERDMFGKPNAPIYRELGHLPLLISWPGEPARDVDALTTSVDLHATLTEIFGVEAGHRTHGQSLLPLVYGTSDAVRDHVVCGVWGRQVHLVDLHRLYSRAPVGSNFPISLWSNRWSTMPRPGHPLHRLPKPDRRAELAFMPGSEVPVIRQPFAPGDMLPFHAYDVDVDRHLLFALDEDPGELENQAGSPSEREAIDLLRSALQSIEAPHDQIERLGLA
ncbi:MAG: sulfatase [Acidimicrobiales bacterium]